MLVGVSVSVGEFVIVSVGVDVPSPPVPIVTAPSVSRDEHGRLGLDHLDVRESEV